MVTFVISLHTLFDSGPTSSLYICFLLTYLQMPFMLFLISLAHLSYCRTSALLTTLLYTHMMFLCCPLVVSLFLPLRCFFLFYFFIFFSVGSALFIWDGFWFYLFVLFVLSIQYKKIFQYTEYSPVLLHRLQMMCCLSLDSKGCVETSLGAFLCICFHIVLSGLLASGSTSCESQF